jgi:hypothetical protein
MAGRLWRDLSIGVLAAVVGHVIICLLGWVFPQLAALVA